MLECEICTDEFQSTMMKGIGSCSHKFCINCFGETFSNAIREKHPNNWKCPVCPDDTVNSLDIDSIHRDIRHIFTELVEYHKNNREFSKSQESRKILELFDNILKDQILMVLDDFRWCPYDNCGSGFLSTTNNRLQCPACGQQVCGRCGRKWHNDHENQTCHDFEMIILKKDPDIHKTLSYIGVECPNCHMRYSVAPGGCLHFDCKQCQKSFCGGCSNFFVKECESPNCQMRGFHAHHPRNCIYYLRDESSDLLEKMLQNEDYKKLDNEQNPRCQMNITGKQYEDKPCDIEVYKRTGFCELHYKEYLITLINRFKIDPIDYYDSDKLNLILSQTGLPNLTQLDGENEDQFKLRLRKEIKNKCPFYITKASR